MNSTLDANKKIKAAYKLLNEPTISISAFENIRAILKGIHPKLDQKLEICSDALDKLQKLQKRDVITLSAEGLPEKTEEEKKRKKALLFFINSVKDLESEIKRIDTELNQAKNQGDSSQSQSIAWGKIIKSAKGPFGIVTIVALVVVGVLMVTKNNSQDNKVVTPKVVVSPSADSKNLSKIKIIIYNGKQIPFDQLSIRNGPDCDSPHYHATNQSVKALDGTVIVDPGSCAFGKEKDVEVIEITASPTPSL